MPANTARNNDVLLSLHGEIASLQERITLLEAEETLWKNLGQSCDFPPESNTPLPEEIHFKFENIFDLTAIQKIQDSFAEATNVASIITDPEGRPITKPSGFCSLCNDVIRKTKLGLKNCMRSDAAFGTLNPLEPIMRPCLSSGLLDGGTSIYVGKRHIANWIIGQRRTSSEPDQKIIAYAKAIGADEEAYRTAYDNVPIMPKEQFYKVCNALCLIANQLSTLAQQNYRQAQAIARRQQAEHALRESEERFRQLSDSTFEAIFIHHKGKILEANKAAITLFGFTREELIGRTINSLAAPEFREAIREYSEQGGNLWFQGEFQCKNTLSIICEVQERNITFQGRNVRVCAVRDITQRIQSEQEAKEKEQQLIQADKMVSLGVLVSGVAHEINNPNSFMTMNLPLINDVWQSITPILDDYYKENGDFLAGGLEYSSLREELPNLVSRMQDGASRIKGIVNNLKDYSRVEPSQLMWDVDINDMIRSSLPLLEKLISMHTNSFTTNLATNLPPVQGNRQRLSQVFINLLVNACEALIDKDDNVTVTSQYLEDLRTVEIVVVDTGSGIPEHLLSKITDPFFTTKRDSGGTGLGLSVSSAIVQEHSGTLQFMPHPDGGTIAQLHLPIADHGEKDVR
ncbi:PocR ligand-binding domain-containing protein [Halodesulfovibrio sp. MK-HDV]|jgi:PAS domain S-box-containing protein|uniref:PocR ligand-binding domain-containing protein n=1 Tax=Halodesulfovibrio sp. MK-HDV TaxID=2599925 RepID=UPI0013680228|nr:PocR ligand-binding domain-containing protein [Halodesulfovibrio sp. MK-HDV]KAF1073688.1 Sporulation kinase A [Halodesulfovibrio sp. MK-HDV]